MFPESHVYLIFICYVLIREYEGEELLVPVCPSQHSPIWLPVIFLWEQYKYQSKMKMQNAKRQNDAYLR